VVNKQEIIHEDDKEDDNNKSSSDDDIGDVFGHKNAVRTKINNEGIMSRHKKKSSMNELAVDVEGPIKLSTSSSSNNIYQRVPQSATQPQVKGLVYNTTKVSKDMNNINQGYSPAYPLLQNPFSIPPQMVAPTHTGQYQILQNIYPSQQPQSAGLSRKPPGFEFMTPKQSQPQYQEFQPAYVQQNTYYVKQSPSPLVPPSTNYDISMLKKQPQSATMNNKFSENQLLMKSKKITNNTDVQDTEVYEIITIIETLPTLEERLEALKGKLEMLLFTQTGSRFIQKQLSDDEDQSDSTSKDLKAQQKDK